jgi:hypothetical protein
MRIRNRKVLKYLSPWQECYANNSYWIGIIAFGSTIEEAGITHFLQYQHSR